MKWTLLPPTAMGVGLFLMIAGFVWPRMIGNSTWTEEQAQRRATAGADVHRLQYEHAFATDPEKDEGPHGRGVGRIDDNGQVSVDRLKAQLDQAHEEWDRAESELKWARAKRSIPSHVLWWLGAFGCLLGVVSYFVLRMEWAQQFVDL
jgi:hypothetical protein